MLSKGECKKFKPSKEATKVSFHAQKRGKKHSMLSKEECKNMLSCSGKRQNSNPLCNAGMLA